MMLEKILNGASGLAQGVAGLFMSNHARKAQEAQSASQFNAQMDYAKNQTQYRVRDALKAGINPLAALGQSANITPTAYGSGAGTDRMIDSIGAIAGGVSKGVSAFFEKANKESTELSLESQRLENEYKRAQIDHLRNMNPGITGGSYTRGIRTDKNSGPQKTVPAEDWLEGTGPAEQEIVTPYGTMFVPSNNAADALDVDFGILNPMAWEWFFRSKLGHLKRWVDRHDIKNPLRYRTK